MQAFYHESRRLYPAIQSSFQPNNMPFGPVGAVEESLELYVVTPSTYI
jgi:hypothetical protein